MFLCESRYDLQGSDYQTMIYTDLPWLHLFLGARVLRDPQRVSPLLSFTDLKRSGWRTAWFR